jgi:hypothetical protein
VTDPTSGRVLAITFYSIESVDTGWLTLSDSVASGQPFELSYAGTTNGNAFVGFAGLPVSPFTDMPVDTDGHLATTVVQAVVGDPHHLYLRFSGDVGCRCLAAARVHQSMQ